MEKPSHLNQKGEAHMVDISEKEETKRKAIEENVKLARESGNKLTQRLDNQGNLVGVNNTMENDLKELDDQSSDNIKKTLFEGDNIVRKKKD